MQVLLAVPPQGVDVRGEVPSQPIDPAPPAEQPTQIPNEPRVPPPADAPDGPLEPVPDPEPARLPDAEPENPELPV